MRHKHAPHPRDFRGVRSVPIPHQAMGSGMDSPVLNEAVKVCLSEIHSRLSEAARIAKAAEACARAGSVTEAVTVSMDIEQLIYEASRLHDAASLLNRLSRA